jgi:hypothetical protein
VTAPGGRCEAVRYPVRLCDTTLSGVLTKPETRAILRFVNSLGKVAEVRHGLPDRPGEPEEDERE